MTRSPGTHGYICECARAGCRERLYLGPGDYQRLRALGTVLHLTHAHGRTVLLRFGEVVACQTAWGRLGEAG